MYRNHCVIKKPKPVRDSKLPSQYPQKMMYIYKEISKWENESYFVTTIPIRTIFFSKYYDIHEIVVNDYVKKYRYLPEEFCKNIYQLPDPKKIPGLGIIPKTYVYFIPNKGKDIKLRSIGNFGKDVRDILLWTGWRKCDKFYKCQDITNSEFTSQLFSSYVLNFTNMLLNTLPEILKKWTIGRMTYTYFPILNLLLTNRYLSFFPKYW